MKRIYLDYAAGRENPSSIHQEGVAAKKVLEAARKKIAGVLHALPDEIIFTSGATEANNLAIYGVINAIADWRGQKKEVRTGADKIRQHIITTAIEHASVLEPIRELERKGEVKATYLPVSSEGFVDLEATEKTLRKNTVLVSIMYANNEIGTVQPIAEIARIIRRHSSQRQSAKGPRKSAILLHVDAAQAPGILPLNVLKLHTDLMSFSAQKFYGPAGVGFLYKRRGVKISPQIFGGGQEFGMRSGTENVAAIAEMADALETAEKMREKESARLAKLREYFINRLLKIPGTVLNGVKDEARLPDGQGLRIKDTLPGIVNVSFAGVEGEWVVIGLDAKGVAVSTGSACTTGGTEASHVIMALGKKNKEAIGAVRFSFGRTTTKRDLDYVLKVLPSILEKGKLS